ncbi:ABC transporter substrate-binding protein [Neorhizobium alkalisoli]|uniref:Thiamine pyrimidine synthase n=1 Tax=Neorhizobium alkalisoli TaxID=528178 RepID=A0A561QPE0_9HYPH|nr:ABC transporter substrate-binding protein [Neorhizobium alkalisoli]TWF52265.1 ABC-type nitrate/sulfonate/bicarbonate transport system substrate-binding protein [Neorhizobium alkalisoli]
MTRMMLTRRASLAALAAIAIPALPVRAQDGKKVSVALDWTPNTNHIGLFIARDKGFYREAGIDLEILPYTDTSASTLVANHVADFGIMGSIGLLTQASAGADLVAAYAVVQTETGRVVFKDDRKDIQRPKDLDGKTYGGFGSAWENALLSSIIRNDGGEGKFETVTLGTSAYQALDSGAVDFTLEVYTWEGVKAELDGVKQRAFRYADFGVPDEHTTLIGSSSAFLSKNPEKARAFVSATRKGYDFAVDHPDEATDMLISANSDALTDRKLIRASLQALIDGHYFRSPAGDAGKIDAKKMTAIADYLFDAKILKDGSGAVLQKKPDISARFVDL